MEWRCLRLQDLHHDATFDHPPCSKSVPGDKLFDSHRTHLEAKADLERYLLSHQNLTMGYASVLAAMGADIEDFHVAPSLSLDPHLPSAAKDEDEYVRNLSDFPDVFRLPLEHTMDEVDEYQDGKDLQRDSLILNGHLLAGAELGYQGIVQETMRYGTSEKRAKRILQVLNRTFSGGSAFDHVLRCFGSEFVDITPASADAKPLAVAVTKGTSIGSAHTRYVLYLQSSGRKICEVDATFTFDMKEEMRTFFLFFEKKLIQT